MISQDILLTGEKVIYDYHNGNGLDMHTYYFDTKEKIIEYEGDSDNYKPPHWHILLASDKKIDGIPTLFEYYSKLFIKYMAENRHPHTKVIIDSTSAQLFEGVEVINTEEFLVD